MSLLDLIPGGRMVQGLVVAAAVAATLGAVTYGVHSYNDARRDEGRVEVQAKWAAAEKDRDKVLADVRQKGIDDTNRLNKAAIDQQKASNDKIAVLNNNLHAALNSLRDRPERPTDASSSGLPAPAAAQSSCTGASLYRPDAEFLVREATRADQLRVDLESCQAQYNSASEALK